MKRVCFVRGEQSVSPPSVLVMNCSSFISSLLFLPSQKAYKQYVLECFARYSVKKMPYAILPKHSPSGHKKVLKNLFSSHSVFFFLLQTVRSFRRVVLILKKNCSCPQVLTQVVWNKPDIENSVPLWIIILAILAGLLLLALLIYVLYKVSELRLLVFLHNVIL